MDKRTKILMTAFLGVVGVLALSNYVYPQWIEPLVKIDGQIATLKDELEVLNRAEQVVNKAKYEYRGYVERVGSMDADFVRNRIDKQFKELVLKHNLSNATVNPPRRVNLDKKTQLKTMVFNVTAEGSLQAVVEFLKDISEMPYLLSVNNPKISPTHISARERRTGEHISLSAGIEVMVLPQQPKIIGELFEDEKLRQPAQHVRYARSDYSAIWGKNPFSEEVRVAEVPTQPKPPEIKNPPKGREKPPEPPPDKRWRDRDQYTLTMAMLMNDGQSKFDEVMLYNQRSKENRYVRVDQDFDGGKLLFVHQRGVLVGREDGRFVYPIGDKLNVPVKVEDAVEFPEIQLASSRIVTPAEGAAPSTDNPDGADVSGLGEPGAAVDGVARANPENGNGALNHPSGPMPAGAVDDPAAQPMGVGPLAAQPQPPGLGPDGVPPGPPEQAIDVGAGQPVPAAVSPGPGPGEVNGKSPTNGLPRPMGSGARARVPLPSGTKDRTGKAATAIPSPPNPSPRKIVSGAKPTAIGGGTKEQKPADPDKAGGAESKDKEAQKPDGE